MDTDSIFKPRPCQRCGVVILTGMCGALNWRVDSVAVPREHAVLLKAYGVTPVVLDARFNKLHGDVWEPDRHDLTKPNRYLVVPHVCGSAHAQRGER